MVEVSSVLEYRPLLFSIAYHLLGSVMEAEDMVQDTFLAWSSVDRKHIHTPKSYLSRMVANRSKDRLTALQKERDTYPGTWLPEPMIEPDWEEPSEDRQRYLSMSILMLMENLNPIERTIYVLRTVFDWEYAEIADLVNKTNTNCRQLLRRAKLKINTPSRPIKSDPTLVQQVKKAFLAASVEQNMEPLINLLGEDVVMYSDGGGKATAAINPIYGKTNCAKFMIGIQRQLPPGLTARLTTINGSAGLILFHNNQPYSALILETDEAKITTMFTVRNPDKMKHFVS